MLRLLRKEIESAGIELVEINLRIAKIGRKLQNSIIQYILKQPLVVIHQTKLEKLSFYGVPLFNFISC